MSSRQRGLHEEAPALALDGGRPLCGTPFPPWPHYAQDEVDAACAVLSSGRVNYWTGEEGRRFEEEFAAAAGCAFGVALANGTLALEAALAALGIGAGDEVIVPARTFVATASSVALSGARPVFADIDERSQNLTADTVRPLITPRTRALIAVHLAGWPCDMDAILELARGHGLRVIEDCAQAVGAAYRGRPVGSFGDAAAFSFCQDKIISTGGEGGMLTTGDPAVRERAWSLKDHGKDYRAARQGGAGSGFRWLHDGLGSNWRMTEMQAAIGRLQLRKLDDWLAARSRNAARLAAGLGAMPALRIEEPGAEVRHAWYRFTAFVRPERLRAGWDRDRVLAAVRAEGVPCFSGSCSEVYREKAFRDAGLQPPRRLPVARRLGETSLAFLTHPTQGEADMERVCAAAGKVLKAAVKP